PSPACSPPPSTAPTEQLLQTPNTAPIVLEFPSESLVPSQRTSTRSTHHAQVCTRRTRSRYVGCRPGRWSRGRYDGRVRRPDSHADSRPVVQAGDAEPGGVAEVVRRTPAQADRPPGQADDPDQRRRRREGLGGLAQGAGRRAE